MSAIGDALDELDRLHANAKMDFVAALKIADAVFEQYRRDQPQWWHRMDGTPILNDISVRMATAFRDAINGSGSTNG